MSSVLYGVLFSWYALLHFPFIVITYLLPFVPTGM